MEISLPLATVKSRSLLGLHPSYCKQTHNHTRKNKAGLRLWMMWLQLGGSPNAPQPSALPVLPPVSHPARHKAGDAVVEDVAPAGVEVVHAPELKPRDLVCEATHRQRQLTCAHVTCVQRPRHSHTCKQTRLAMAAGHERGDAKLPLVLCHICYVCFVIKQQLRSTHARMPHLPWV